MPAPSENHPALAAFHRAASQVPAYQTLLAEAGVDAATIRHGSDFARVPVLDKAATFQRFPVEQLCRDGRLGRLGSVLTSSGHSGLFAFGLTAADAQADAAHWIDGLLDLLFEVRTRPTLLINCLPMGVKVPTLACTLAETSVRPDMVVGLVRAFGAHYAQLILVGEAAFLKHTLELGARTGVDWRRHRVHLIAGEEPLAENARKYLERFLGIDERQPDHALVVSSMGVAELGLNLFFEAPPRSALIRLRRRLHEDAELRHAVLGPTRWVPALFTYDPRRIFVEFDPTGRLIVTMLDPSAVIPLIRYATGDRGRVVHLPAELRPALEAAGVDWAELASFPLVAIDGRGEHVLAGGTAIYPEAVKEGIYHDPALAALTTANFRLAGGAERARVRLQLSPGVAASPQLAERFRNALVPYTGPLVEVSGEAYESFGDGMALDYERKFPYLAR